MARFIFFDWETQSDADLPVCGTLNYALDPSTRPLLKSWCVDQDGPVKLWCPDLSAELAPEVWAYVTSRVNAWGAPPAEIAELFAGEDPVYVVAWNAAFDRTIWQQVATPDCGFPELRLEQVLDAMAQAQASNLPGQLDWAGRMLGLGSKTVGGKAIMLRFARRSDPLPGAKVLIDEAKHRPGAVQKAIEDWSLYLDYSGQDTALMRSLWYTTRPLDAQEWAEYWTSERINDRGMLADLDVCAGAVQYREEESEFVAAECVRLTGGAITRPTLTAQINAWLYEQLPDDLATHIIKARDEETGEVTKLSGNKQALGRLLEDIYVSDAPPPDNVTEFIELLQFGRSSSAVKFEKILNQSVDGRLTNSYVFNGAGQTGRMCVAAETLVETPTGPRPIVDLRLSDKVITHLGRAQRVKAVIYKGREQMFDLAGPNGEFVTATLAHRVLTRKGWKKLHECFEKAPDGQWALREGCAPLSFAGNAYGADRDGVRNNATHGLGNSESAPAAGRTSAVARGVQITQQDGRREPDARTKDRGGEDIAQWPSSSLERSRVHVRAPTDRGEDAGVGDVAGASGSSSHRRGQDEQQSGQSGDHDEMRAPVLAQADSWTLVPVGEREVWDITVARDASYIAQGLAHHNSSRGVQIHNLPRDKVPNELDVLDMIAARVPIEDLRKLPLTKDDMKRSDRPPTSVNALLARLIRPTFHAPKGKMMVWGDWSAIEARVTPWLANTRDAERAVLDAFRNGDDLYLLNAESIFHVPYDVLRERYENGDPEAKGQRQAGKVAVLALGFLGGVGALRAMARGYGMRLTDAEAKLIVDGWRERNRWARRFGDKCEEAAFAAVNKPGQMFDAGRLRYQFMPGLMGGTLVCFLPDMRPIVYPRARISTVEKFGKEAKAITYLNGMGYRSLWNGLQVENATQATAASILRSTLTRLEQEETIAETVGDTHDEIICEAPEAYAETFAAKLEETMVRGFDWSAGLPLAAEVEVDWYYHK